MDKIERASNVMYQTDHSNIAGQKKSDVLLSSLTVRERIETIDDLHRRATWDQENCENEKQEEKENDQKQFIAFYGKKIPNMPKNKKGWKRLFDDSIIAEKEYIEAEIDYMSKRNLIFAHTGKDVFSWDSPHHLLTKENIKMAEANQKFNIMKERALLAHKLFTPDIESKKIHANKKFLLENLEFFNIGENPITQIKILPEIGAIILVDSINTDGHGEIFPIHEAQFITFDKLTRILKKKKKMDKMELINSDLLLKDLGCLSNKEFEEKHIKIPTKFLDNIAEWAAMGIGDIDNMNNVPGARARLYEIYQTIENMLNQ